MVDQVLDIPRLPQFDMARLIERRPGPNASAAELAQYNADTTEYLRRLNVCLVEWFDEWGRTTNSIISSGTLRVEDEGTTVVATANAMNFVGAGVTVTDAGSNEATVTIPGAGAATITTQDEGVTLSSAVTTLNFVGAGVTATGAAATTTVTIPGSTSPLTTKGDIYTRSTVDAREPIGATFSMVPMVDSAQTNGWTWKLPTAVGSGVAPMPAQWRHRFTRPRGHGLTTVNQANWNTNTTGSVTRAVSNTNLYTSTPAHGFTSATLLNSSTRWMQDDANYWLGSAAGLGGYYIAIVFGIHTFLTASRFFIGLNGDGLDPGNVDPSTLVNVIGIGWDDNSTQIALIHNDATGTATYTNLGASFPCNTDATDVYLLELSAVQAATTVSWRVSRRNTGDNTSGVISTNLPANTLLMYAGGHFAGNTAGSASSWTIFQGESFQAIGY